MLGGGSDPQPLPLCHKLLSSTRSSAAWPDTAGAGGGGGRQLSIPSLPGKNSLSCGCL